MDLRLQANRQLHYGVNGGTGRNPRPGDDDALQFLSQEEQECLQFFEDTIDSLQVSLEDNDPMQMTTTANCSGAAEEVNGPLTSSPNPAVIMASPLAIPQSPKDQDIIDLVRPELDMVHTREPNFNPMNPDFQSMLRIPESHFEIKPKHDSMVSLPSEHSSLMPSGSYGPTESHPSYHPPGCIPTPVLIAHKIAKNQAGGTSKLLATSLVRRSSLESKKPSNYGTDTPIKQSPSPSAKPNRFPTNINVILGSKDHHNQPQSNVNIEERRVQMLTNLTGSHPLLQQASQQAMDKNMRNIPRRSISFKDPLPDKSRMEALSKLGLTRNRAMSGGILLLDTPKSTSLDHLTGAETRAKPLEASVAPTSETSIKLPEANVTTPSLSQINVERGTEILRSHSLKSHEARNPQWSPSPPAITQSSNLPPPLENKAAASLPPEVTFPQARNPQWSPSPPAVTQSSNLPPPLENKAPASLPPEVTFPQARNHQWSPSPPAVTQSSNLPPPLENKAPASLPPEITSPQARNPQWSPSPPAITQSSNLPPPLENKAAASLPPEVTFPQARNHQWSPSPPAVTQSSNLPPPLENKAPASLPPEITSPQARNPQWSPSPPAITQSSNLPPPLENKAPASLPPEVTFPQARNPQWSPSPPAVTQSSNLPPSLENKAPASLPPEVTSPQARNPQLSPSPPAVTQSSNLPPLEKKAPALPPPEVTSLEFNSYGGKSIVVNQSFPSKSEPATFPMTHEPKILSPALANPSQFNRFGGKSKVVTPVPVVVNRSDLPDILSSHIDKSQTLPSKSELQPSELNSYGGRTRTINPSAGLYRPLSTPARSYKVPAPAPAPKPSRHSYHGPVIPQISAQRALSPEHIRRSGSLFRPQSITVKFNGRNGSEESRRDALRKLGLLKES